MADKSAWQAEEIQKP